MIFRETRGQGNQAALVGDVHNPWSPLTILVASMPLYMNVLRILTNAFYFDTKLMTHSVNSIHNKIALYFDNKKKKS